MPDIPIRGCQVPPFQPFIQLTCTCSKDTKFLADGRKMNHYSLVDQHGCTHLAVLAVERDARDGHYQYTACEPFASSTPWKATSQAQAMRYLAQFLAHDMHDVHDAAPSSQGRGSARGGMPVMDTLWDSRLRPPHRAGATHAAKEPAAACVEAVPEAQVGSKRPADASCGSAGEPPMEDHVSHVWCDSVGWQSPRDVASVLLDHAVGSGEDSIRCRCSGL